MPRGYRLAIIALGLTLFAGAALSQEEHGSPVPIERPTDTGVNTQAAAEIESEADDTAADALGGGEKAESADADERKRRADERDEKDLIAQERMADAADSIVHLTWIQVGVGVLGTFALIGTLLLMKSANRVSLRVAEAAAITVRSDIEAKTAKPYVTKLQLARSLGLLGPGEDASAKELLANGFISISLTNSGQTDARLNGIRYGHHVGGLPPVPRYTDYMQMSKYDYLRREELTRSFFIRASQGDIDRVVAGETLWVFGQVIFENYLGDEDAQPFCGMFFLSPAFAPNGQLFLLGGPDAYWQKLDRQRDQKPSRYRRLKAAWRG